MQAAAAEGRVRNLRQRVGNQDLLGHAEGEEDDAARELLGRMAPLTHLLFDGSVADDGAGHQVREERLEAAEVDEVGHRPRITAVDVDRVTHRLERVERDAHR